MFQRGHLGHIALTAASPEAFETMRQRPAAARASTGVIEDLGAFRVIWFDDPDGMRGELALITRPGPLGHPRTEAVWDGLDDARSGGG